MTAFFRQHLKGEKQWQGIFRGEWIPSSVAKADSGKVKLYTQYSDTKRQEVDNFEGAHSLTTWKTSTIGGQVTHDSTLPADPKEDELYKEDTASPHETGGLVLRWDGPSDLLRFTIPGKYKDVKKAKYEALSFRISQKVGGTNPVNKIQDFYVTLEDGDTPAQSRAIKVSKFAQVPPPHQREDYTVTDSTGKKVTIKVTKSAMCTVRIPLHVFEIDVWGLDKVNLENVKSVTFDFGISPKGEIDIDSVEFTN
jgi:hypothetical protein